MRFAHEQQVAEAALVQAFSDRLLSEDERDSTFALFALSAYVSTDVIERIADGGEQIISNATLEKLSLVAERQVSSVANSILKRRNISSPNKKTELVT